MSHTLNVHTIDGSSYEVNGVDDHGAHAVVSAVNLGEHSLSIDQYFEDGSRIRQFFVIRNVTHVAILTEPDED